ncbi:DNA polymerase III subunit gamma/tau [Microbacterium sp. CFBP9034]|uniref:DNA polymerase III subunit gamma/tau n=1 Tax=Microbacterium sp. CFBP9034 TaxID=3096540 RepID=UPI002A6B82E2|nr:DNA polymerase III subunit gamma/tau [Microbacterium sp. CFBP9034]MDY0909429.1 DNA polymerase III subunit gamma/tau [Microbacterium sp. CFBP9034]
MTAGRDDDALTWDGDDDPTLEVGNADESAATSSTTESAALPEGWNAVGKGSDAVETAPDRAEVSSFEAPAEKSDVDDLPVDLPLGNASLIALGVIGGFSVLYAVGWLIGGLRLQGAAQFLVAPVAYQVSLWLAVVAPLVWFGSVYVLTAGSRPWVRFTWLIAGVLLLIPWPFIMVGAIGR